MISIKWSETAQKCTGQRGRNSNPVATLIFYPKMKYSPLAFSPVNLCKIDVFTSNIMVLHHKMSQTVKIKVNRYTNIYLLINLFKIYQFIFIFCCISALLSFIQQNFF